jgi:phosphate transport system protein
MSILLLRELESLRKYILSLGALVEDNLDQAVRALQHRDSDVARTVEEKDEKVDRLEIDVEEECLKILALHQPVATDLRFIVAVMKMNRDLERIGDQAVNIAHKALRLAGEAPPPVSVDFESMAASARRMVRESLDAMVNLDCEQARRVRSADDVVDEAKQAVHDTVLEALRREPVHAEAMLAMLGAARNLERVADLATNIAADVIYMIEGDIVRHGHDAEPTETIAPGRGASSS